MSLENHVKFLSEQNPKLIQSSREKRKCDHSRDIPRLLKKVAEIDKILVAFGSSFSINVSTEICNHPLHSRTYIGHNQLKCDLCGGIFN